MLREITFDSKKVPAFIDGAINSMTLSKQTGILNKFDKCTVTASIDYTVSGYGTITFNDGAIVICGRAIYIEAGTTLAVPITSTAGGSIGVKVDLNQNAGSQVAFYTKTTQTLTQQDLNENRADGIYEFEIFKYTSNGIILTLTYQTASVFDANEDIFQGIFDGTLQVGSAENADNADTLNELETLNGRTLVVGDTVIPSNQILYKNDTGLDLSATSTTITFDKNIVNLHLKFKLYLKRVGIIYQEIVVFANPAFNNQYVGSLMFRNAILVSTTFYDVEFFYSYNASTNTISLQTRYANASSLLSADCKLYRIDEIIE